MGVKLRKHGTVTATFATAQQVDISHANDSVRVGDGTDLMGPLTNVGGVLCFPVSLRSDNAGLATSANLTAGTARTKITDGVDNVGVETVGAEKALKVAVISTVGGGAAPAFTDDAAFTVGTTQCTPIGALADETAPDSVDEGDVGALRMTLDRLLKIQVAGVATGIAVPVTDNGGLISIDDGGGSITVDGTFWQATQPVSAASLPLPTGAATEATLAAQSAKLPATLGQKAMAASMAVVLASDQSAVPVSGTFWQATQPVSGPLTDAQLRATAVPVSGTFYQATQPVSIAATLAVAGEVAHDAIDSGNPQKVGGQARQTNPTAVADADRVNAIFDDIGRQVVVPYHARDLVTRSAAITLTTTTETTVIAAAGAGVFVDLVQLLLTNTSSTAVRVDFRDATLGTVQFSVALAANGGAVVTFPATCTQTTANNNWTAQLSAAVTDVRILAIGVKNV